MTVSGLFVATSSMKVFLDNTMEDKLIHADNISRFPRNAISEFGYEIDDSKDAIEQGLQKGASLVKEVKMAGEEIRHWAIKTLTDTHLCIDKLKKATEHDSPKKALPYESDRRIWEIAFWETEISRMIRLYFSNVSNTMSQLKRLNPPLKTHHLDPFMDAMLSDRRTSMTCLEPLAHVLDELSQIKARIYLDLPQEFHVKPFKVAE